MHFDNWIFFLIVLVAMLFRLLGRAANKASKGYDNTNKRSTSPPPLPRAPVESDDVQIRKFLDALGQPAGSTPPPPVAHRTDIPPRPVAPIQPPSPYPRRPKQQIASSKTSREPAPVFEVQERSVPVEPQPEMKAPVKAYAAATSSTPAPARTETSIATLLRSPSGLRDAIILREIFGPPRSLQPFDLAGSA
jgi:hypothetical protein